MIERAANLRRMRGRISRRLLVNALVDLTEVAPHLPLGVRPHVVDGGTVVGCCLLELEHLRPSWAPSAVGVSIRAAAHRISIEWEDADGPRVGVYVPVRHTDSRLAVLAGGRAFPGVHRRAIIDLAETDGEIRWSVEVPGSAGFGLGVVAANGGQPASASDPVGRACIDATLGLSPGFDGGIQCVEMAPAQRRAQRVDIESLDSEFMASFASATLTSSYLMTDVDVTWAPASWTVSEPEPVS